MSFKVKIGDCIWIPESFTLRSMLVRLYLKRTKQCSSAPDRQQMGSILFNTIQKIRHITSTQLSIRSKFADKIYIEA